mmetsp:Transcript_19393/g.38025  ORF Transcript_19393/g.38025 Transcript_19393/m.38025 type:complete len:81 (+) Transcript_19393:182-424(+)
MGPTPYSFPWASPPSSPRLSDCIPNPSPRAFLGRASSTPLRSLNREPLCFALLCTALHCTTLLSLVPQLAVQQHYTAVPT